MPRYIDADALQLQLQKKKPGAANVRYTDGFNDALLRFKSMVHNAPTADVVPVVRGEWICKYDHEAGETDVTCSSCMDTRTINGCYETTSGESCYDEDNFCPNCGADMRRGSEVKE